METETVYYLALFVAVCAIGIMWYIAKPEYGIDDIQNGSIILAFIDGGSQEVLVVRNMPDKKSMTVRTGDGRIRVIIYEQVIFSYEKED